MVGYHALHDSHATRLRDTGSLTSLSTFRRGDGEGVLDLGSVGMEEALNMIELAAKTATPFSDVFEAGQAEAPAPAAEAPAPAADSAAKADGGSGSIG